MSIFIGGLPNGCAVPFLWKSLILCLKGLILAGGNLEAWQGIWAGSNIVPFATFVQSSCFIPGISGSRSVSA